MNVFRRLVTKHEDAGESRYVCELCGATFDDAAVVVCPRCRGFVTKRNA